jgi:hypothetical protein
LRVIKGDRIQDQKIHLLLIRVEGSAEVSGRYRNRVMLGPF